ncbi:MAG: type II toxin-antitoxin system PemK/MazF family toxin [Candidatus Poribacteria bacterium]|nr:type II toxin-antitoxin system PemK/MazF family toxin [Candidatus Poribacteria bacterium]
MKERDVIVVYLKDTEGQLKLRPAVCLRQLPHNYHAFIACGLTTRLQYCVEGFDEIVTPQDDNLERLRETSLIRLGFLSQIQMDEIVGHIGSISEERHKRLLKKLSDYLEEVSE